MSGECELDMTLHYRHSLGDLRPYFDGLEAGRAMATRCGTCGLVWFAPRLTCSCAAAAMEWIELPGQGEILAVTSSLSILPLSLAEVTGNVGLIRMEGAGNAVFGRISGDGIAVGRRVCLIGRKGDRAHPVQAADYRILA